MWASKSDVKINNTVYERFGNLTTNEKQQNAINGNQAAGHER